MLGRGSGDPARQALELAEHRVATVLEVGDHRLDLTPAPVRVVDDPLGLGLGPLARLCRRGIGLLAGLLHIGVGVSSDLAPVRVGLLARLVRVLVGLVAQRFGGRVRLYEALTRLPRRLLPDLLRRVVGLREDVSDLLAGSGKLGPDPLGRVANGAVALEPVGELLQELVDLVAVVAANRVGEACVADPVDRVRVQGLPPRSGLGSTSSEGTEPAVRLA